MTTTILDKYPHKTPQEAKSSLEKLKSDHERSDISVADYRSIRDLLQAKIAEKSTA